MSGQSVTVEQEQPDEIIRMQVNQDPGTASDILVGIAPRDMWFEHGSFRHSVANGTALTGAVGYSANGSALAVDSGVLSKSGSTIDFNATADTMQTIQGDPSSNFVPKGALVKVILSASAGSSLGVVSGDLQFTTRRK